MSNDTLAERALASYAAEQEAKQLEKTAQEIREREHAIEKIEERAKIIGVCVERDSIVRTIGFKYTASVKLTDDAELRIIYRPRGGPHAEAEVHVCDQLYWNDPPGVE